MSPQDLALFYVSCIRSVVNLAIPAFYHSLLQYLKNELVRLEKRVLSIIMSGMDYHTALERLGVKPMKDHHEHLCNKRFQSVMSDPNDKINNLLPARHSLIFVSFTL